MTKRYSVEEITEDIRKFENITDKFSIDLQYKFREFTCLYSDFYKEPLPDFRELNNLSDRIKRFLHKFMIFKLRPFLNDVVIDQNDDLLHLYVNDSVKDHFEYIISGSPDDLLRLVASKDFQFNYHHVIIYESNGEIFVDGSQVFKH